MTEKAQEVDNPVGKDTTDSGTDRAMIPREKYLEIRKIKREMESLTQRLSDLLTTEEQPNQDKR